MTDNEAIAPPLHEQIRAYFAADPGRHTAEWREALARELIDTAGTIVGRDRVIALEYAALPDDSPHKITREDVREVRVAANQARAKSREYINAPELCHVHEQTADALDGLAAKLSALLPPK